MNTFELLDGRVSNLSLVAEGSGAARVYKGRLDGAVDVAVKVVPRPRSDSERERIRRYFSYEVELASRIAHRNVRTALLSQEAESTPELGQLTPYGAFIQVFRWEERSLRDDLKRGPLSPVKVREIAEAMADALAAVHGADGDTLHRDIKPENILVSGDDLRRAVLTDFGIAVQQGGGASTSMFRGTLRYMAPEQFRFNRDERETRQTDLYSFALVLWECLTGTILRYDEALDAFDLHKLRRESVEMETLRIDGVQAVFLSEAFEQFLHPEPEVRPESALRLREMFVDALIDDGLLEDVGAEAAPSLPWRNEDLRGKGGALWVYAKESEGDDLARVVPGASWKFAPKRGAWFTQDDVVLAESAPADEARSAGGGRKRKVNADFMRPVQANATLAAIVGSSPMQRTELTKRLWAYIKMNGLQDRKNRRMINADEKLAAVFGGRRQVSMFDMTKLVSKNLL